MVLQVALGLYVHQVWRMPLYWQHVQSIAQEPAWLVGQLDMLMYLGHKSAAFCSEVCYMQAHVVLA